MGKDSKWNAEAAFTAASADMADWVDVGEVADDQGPAYRGHNVAALFVSSSGAASNEIEGGFALVDDSDQVFAYFPWYAKTSLVIDGSATATRRQAADNGSGDYVCDVKFVQSGTHKVDLLGASSGPNRLKWKMGVTNLDSQTSVDLRVSVSRIA